MPQFLGTMHSAGRAPVSRNVSLSLRHGCPGGTGLTICDGTTAPVILKVRNTEYCHLLPSEHLAE